MTTPPVRSDSGDTAVSKPPTSGPEWDDLYASKAEFFSGEANSSLVEEVSNLEPGRALDVGCGEGADAVWLAHQGWEVTGLEVSKVALDRAAARAEQAGVTAQWIHSGLADAALPPASFDLVVSHYPALRSSDCHDSERALVESVAPGGLLLMVYHAGFDGDDAKARGIEPADYVLPADMVSALLQGNWSISIDTWSPRRMPLDGAGHELTHNVIMRAQRKS
ncbi:MAG: methyltransferase type 11 [Mycobacterium sp.]|jgi:SAM-dependent methyltransferase|nr:methyltransferase type 11 [Mycobacterium sp.]